MIYCRKSLMSSKSNLKSRNLNIVKTYSLPRVGWIFWKARLKNLNWLFSKQERKSLHTKGKSSHLSQSISSWKLKLRMFVQSLKENLLLYGIRKLRCIIKSKDCGQNTRLRHYKERSCTTLLKIWKARW